MKAKKKPHGMKHKIREEKKKEERTALAIIAAILISVIFIAGFLINSMLNQPPTISSSEPKAAIVDQLSLTYPNQTFGQTATNTLKQAGYSVDYYPGEQVTVEFYRNLPTHGYKVIIFRVHSTATNREGTEGHVNLFTSERVTSGKYLYEQLTEQLVGVVYSREEEEKEIMYFGISPSFVTQSMRDRFQNTLILMMGCEGLDNPLMAKAFVEKGAKVYISWSESVLASHTDTATTQLLQHLIKDKQTIEQAVTETMKEVGPNPSDNSILIYYPLEAGDQIIEDINGN